MIQRYGPNYRQNELSKICQAAQRGDSLAFVGIAGTGKSNLTNFLCKDSYGYKAQYLDGSADKIHFVLVDATTWEGSVQSLLAILLEALERVADTLPIEIERPATIPLAPEGERTRRHLNQLLEWFCNRLNHKLMFILDDFDEVIQTGPLSTLEELSRLRNNHRNQLSYLLLTKVFPHILGKEYDIQNRSKFYDLFKGRIFSLSLHTHEDSRQMLRSLNANANNELSRAAISEIQFLAGGHARLMRLLFDAWLEHAPPQQEEVRYFSHHHEIRNECQRIFDNLYGHEREMLLQVAHTHTTDPAWLDYFCTRGLLLRAQPIIWFSPLMAEHLRSIV